MAARILKVCPQTRLFSKHVPNLTKKNLKIIIKTLTYPYAQNQEKITVLTTSALTIFSTFEINQKTIEKLQIHQKNTLKFHLSKTVNTRAL